MQTAVADRLCAQALDLLTAAPADPKMGEGSQRRINFVSLDQYAHERPRSVIKLDHCAMSIRIDLAMDYPHRGVFLIKSDTSVRVGHYQRDVREANVMVWSHIAFNRRIHPGLFFQATMLTSLSGT
jgi:hypothetical protein